MTAPIGPTQKVVSSAVREAAEVTGSLASGTVIGAAKMAGLIAGAPVTQKVVVGTTHVLADNYVGKFVAGQVENVADRVASAPAVQKAAAKAEGLVTNVLNSSPVAKDLAVGLFNKVNAFIKASGLKSPLVKAFQMGEDALEQLQSGRKFADTARDTIGELRNIHETISPGNNTAPAESFQEAFNLGNHALEMIRSGKSTDDIIKETKSGLKILEDTLQTPASTKANVQDLEMKSKILGVELRASDDEEFANTAFNAIIKMNSQKIEVPRIRLSDIFPKDEHGHFDKGFTNHETMPASKVAVFFNANANWADAAKSSQRSHSAKWQSTSSPEHEIYHAVGRTMYNGAAGNEKLVKSNAMPEALRLEIQGKVQNIETPEDFMGEIFAHIMVNGHQKELTPHYQTYKQWGGQFPKDFNGGVLPLPARPLAKPPSPLDYKA